MSKTTNITPELLRQLLRYEPDTGLLYWLPRPLCMFKNQRLCNSWNQRFAHKLAMQQKNQNGYKKGAILGKALLAHRVAWALHYGAWPNNEIDHTNHIVDDNKISNLRDITHAENMRNTSLRKDNKSGICGVREGKDKWAAAIVVDKKLKKLGLHNSKIEAIKAREAANNKYKFHQNHGT